MAPRRPAEPQYNAKVLTAAATRLKVDAKGKANVPKPEKWQDEAWDIYDLVGEVKQAVTFLANVVSGVRLYIALMPDHAEQEPQPVPAGTIGGFEADQVLERLRTGSTHGGLGGLLAESVINLKVAGEYYLLGEPERLPNPAAATPEGRAGNPERWDVRSINEVEVKDRGEVLIRDMPGQNSGRKIRLPQAQDPLVDDQAPEEDEVAILLRIWQRHPRYSALADCALRAVLTECDELLLLSRAIRGAARSRLASAGILLVANEYSFPVQPDEGDAAEDPEVDPFMRKLAKALLDPINDESSPEGQVPLVVRGPSEVIKEAPIVHVKLERPLDAVASALRSELIGRLGHSLDIPVEQLTGMANVNHWTAWQVDGASWARYGQPTTSLIVASWTEGLLWPMLEEAGIDPAAAHRLIIWYDPADAIVDPDESKSADELFDRLAISWEAYRQRKGAREDEAPDDAELDRRAELGLIRGAVSTGNGMGPPGDGSGAAPPARSNGSRAVAASAIAAAARPQRLGERLMRIDRRTRLRITEVAEGALFRSLERAGARVRSRAQGDRNLAAALSTVPAHQVTRRVDAAIVAQLGLTEEDLIEGGLEQARPQFDARVRQAQEQARRAMVAEFDLDDLEEENLQRQQDRDRDEAWVWLAAALTALARERLHNPAPTAAPGEFDATTAVPPGIIREAMARAGGGLPEAGQPMGGVATGPSILDLWAQHGRVVGGWEWVYGDPGTRTNPFPGHEDLDGVQFASWDDPVLLISGEDDWLGVTYYRPGDHMWCQCDFIPLGPDESAPTEEERVSDLMVALDSG